MAGIRSVRIQPEYGAAIAQNTWICFAHIDIRTTAYSFTSMTFVIPFGYSNNCIISLRIGQNNDGSLMNDRCNVYKVSDSFVNTIPYYIGIRSTEIGKIDLYFKSSTYIRNETFISLLAMSSEVASENITITLTGTESSLMDADMNKIMSVMPSYNIRNMIDQDPLVGQIRDYNSLYSLTHRTNGTKTAYRLQAVTSYAGQTILMIDRYMVAIIHFSLDSSKLIIFSDKSVLWYSTAFLHNQSEVDNYCRIIISADQKYADIFLNVSYTTTSFITNPYSSATLTIIEDYTPA